MANSWLDGYTYRVTIPLATLSVWQPSHYYAAGTIIVPTVSNGYCYAVKIAGTSGTTEPTWTLLIDYTTPDGGVTWVIQGSDLYVLKLEIDNTIAANTPGHIHCNGHCVDLTKDIRFGNITGGSNGYYRKSATGPWWITVPLHPCYEGFIYCYYGKTDDTDASSMQNVFWFSDNFETGNLSRWAGVQASWSAQNTVVEEGSYAAKGVGTSAATKLLYNNALFPSAVIHGWVRKNSVSVPSGIGYPCVWDNNGIAVLLFIMPWSSPGHFGYYDGAGHALPVDTEFSADTWYEFEVAIDLVNGLWRWLYVKDGDKGTAPLKNMNGTALGLGNYCAYEGFQADNASPYVTYYDEYWIRPYMYPEPAWSTPGSEISSIEVSAQILAVGKINVFTQVDQVKDEEISVNIISIASVTAQINKTHEITALVQATSNLAISTKIDRRVSASFVAAASPQIQPESDREISSNFEAIATPILITHRSSASFDGLIVEIPGVPGYLDMAEITNEDTEGTKLRTFEVYILNEAHDAVTKEYVSIITEPDGTSYPVSPCIICE